MMINGCPSYESTLKEFNAAVIAAITGEPVSSAPLSVADITCLRARMEATEANTLQIAVARTKVSLAILQSLEAKLSKHSKKLPDELLKLFISLEKDYHKLQEIADTLSGVSDDAKRASINAVKSGELDTALVTTLHDQVISEKSKLDEIVNHVVRGSELVEEYSVYLDMKKPAKPLPTPEAAPETPTLSSPAA